MNEERDEADAAEELLERPSVPEDPEVPEADALEQAAELQETPEDPESVGDAPEADALEQARAVGGPEDEDRR